MGKHLWSKNSDDQSEDNHPGCVWGILHVLDYHHWHSTVKKIIPHKKHNGRRHAKRKGSRKPRLDIHDSGEEQNAETSHFLVDQGTRKTSSTNKRFLNAHVKSLISEEMSTEEDHKQWGRMKATDKLVACNKNFDVYGTKNVEYLEHNQLSESHTFFPEKPHIKARETLVDQKLMETKQFSGNASHYRFKEYKDILKLLEVNKELFFKIIQNADDGIADCFHSMHTSNTRTRLTKSGSFPVADLSRSRNSWPSKLEQKQNEMWSFRKGEKLLAGILAPVLVASKFPKDLYTKSGPLMANDSGGSVLNQETSCSSLGSTQALDKNGSSEVVIDLLKDIKQRIENVVEGGENDNNFAFLDALLSRVPSGCRPSTGGKEMAERWNENRIGTESKDCSSSCHETDGPVCGLSKETLTHIRRTSYPNESTDKYARLIDYSFSRDAKRPSSKSLKLTNEYEIQSGGHAPISFRRIHSLPHFDYYCSLQNEVSHDAHLAGMLLPVMTVVDNCTNVESDCHDEPKPVSLPASTEKCVSLDVNEETKCINSMVDVTDASTRMEYSASLTVGINDEKTTKIDGLSEGIDESNSQTTAAEFPISEGLECRCNYFYEKESSVNSQNRSNTDSLTCSSCSTVNAENYENVNNSVKNQSHIELYTRDDADFNYVREILERLGFIKNSFLRTWDLTDQLFEEVEACWPHEPECAGEDICACCCHHQLLFDLVNDALLQIYDRSFTYYPRALSFSCQIHPMPVGYHVLEEVWASISRSISSSQELEQSLDCVVAQNLAKEDGWMNLQLETECVALELEDLIFDTLLEEFLCSLDC